MPDESLLRDQARYAIRSGKLPSRQPDRTWGGPGVGVVCIICDQPVAQDQMEFAIGFAGDETMPGVDTYHVHLHCFAAWEFERHQDGGPHSRRVMNDLFRNFLDGVSTRGGYCLDCLSEIYGEPAKAVSGYLSAMALSGRQARCANCDEDRETFRSDLSS